MIKDKKISINELHQIYSLLAFYTESHMPIAKGVALTWEEIKNDRLKEVENKINKGSSIKSSFKESGLCDSFIEANLEIGSRIGNFEKTFKIIEQYLDGKIERKKEKEKMIIYPIIILIMLFVFAGFILFFAVPQMNTVYTTMEIIPPKYLQNIFLISEYIDQNTAEVIWSFLLSALAIGSLIIILRKKENLAPYFLKSRILKNTIVSKSVRDIAWQLSLLLGNEMDLVEALNIIKDSSGSKFEKKEIEKLISKLLLGKSLSQSCMDLNKLFSVGVIAYLKTGEDTGNLSENIYYIYKLEARKQKNSNEKFIKLIQPAVVIFLGIVVAGFISLLLPLLDSSVLYGGF